jgi:penicillin amidase
VTTGRRILLLTLIGLALILGVAAGFWWWSGRMVPPLSGQERVADLARPVQIEFDRYAIPHVYANSRDDLWTAVGYLHGRERLWQMELYRRAAQGGLSELFGERMLPVDRRFLRLGLRRAAEAELARMAPPVRAALERYARGVNAAVQAGGEWRLPLEFYALRTRPAPWRPVDTLAISKLMAWRLGENHAAELVRAALGEMLSPDQIAELMGTPPAFAPRIVERADGLAALPPAGRPSQVPALWTKSLFRGPAFTERLPEGLRWLSRESQALSNSWVVSGSRTATGRPLLANDPHLGVEMPAIWYEAHLIAPDLDVAGVTIPGIPFVVIGHNQRIAWGLTNVGADVQDLYVERIDVKRRLYLNRGTWVPLKTEQHEILVRGRAPEQFEVLLTERGPVASAELWQASSSIVSEPPLADRALSFRWDVIMHGDTSGTFEALGHAANWEQFLAAVRRLGAPAQNFVYADVEGNIGYAMSGLIPARTSHDGSAPSAGGSGDGGWRGFVDTRTLPTVFNPPSGILITANNEVDSHFPHVIVRDWVAPFRALRIRRLLEGQTGLDVKAFQRIQSDRTSEAAELVLPAVDAASNAARLKKAGATILAALDRLRLWDRRADDRSVVTLYETFVAALWRRTFVDELGEPVFRQYYEWAARERYAGLHMVIRDPTSRWWDDQATIDKRETRDDVVMLAAEDAILQLTRRFGPESEQAWDRLHAVKFSHPLSAGGRPLDWFFSRGPIPIAGDGETVNKTTVDVREPYRTADLSTYRQILDVGAWDNSQAVITTGQSGHPRSPHYFDQNPLWREGEYHTLPFSRQAVVDARVTQLVLVP